MSVNYPQTVFDANTIATSIHDNWSLSGLLALAEDVDPDITNEGVYIFAHQNPEGIGRRIVILVRSATPRENVIEHPVFDEVRYVYEVWTHYVLENIEESNWLNAESLVQQMQDEILRILKLSFDPANHIGVYFTTDRKWENRDDFTQASPQMNRVLTFTLTRLRSRSNEVPVGYGGQMILQITSSDGTFTNPIQYIYTEAYHVEFEEGWDTVEEFVTPPTVLPIGAPVQFTGRYSGLFQCEIYPKVSDIGATTEYLNQLYQPISSNHISGGIVGEIPRLYFRIATTNSDSTHSLLDDIVVRPTRLRRLYDLEQLVGFRIQGKAYRVGTMTAL